MIESVNLVCYCYYCYCCCCYYYYCYCLWGHLLAMSSVGNLFGRLMMDRSMKLCDSVVVVVDWMQTMTKMTRMAMTERKGKRGKVVQMTNCSVVALGSGRTLKLGRGVQVVVVTVVVA